MNTDQSELRPSQPRCAPKCSKCRNHNRIVPRKGHLGRCPYAACICEKCTATTVRRANAAGRRQKATTHQKEVDAQLLLNLKMDNCQRKRKHEEDETSATRGKTMSGPYRFSGHIQNNTFFPVNRLEAVSPPHGSLSTASSSPPSYLSGASSTEVDSTTAEVHSPPEMPGPSGEPSGPPLCPQPCPLCPYEPVPMMCPPMHMGYPQYGEYPPYLPHPMANPWMAPPPFPGAEHVSPPPDVFDPDCGAYLSPTPYQDQGMLMHPIPTPPIRGRYPFGANVMSRHMANFRGPPM